MHNSNNEQITVLWLIYYPQQINIEVLLTIKFYFLFSLNTQKGIKSFKMDFLFELFSFAYEALLLLYVFMHEIPIYYYFFSRYLCMYLLLYAMP